MIDLLLLRHAKSSWDRVGLADRERPLSQRGMLAASAMGRHMAAAGLVPDFVLCSPARRAQDTWAHLSKELPGVISVEVVEGLYDSGGGTRLFELIRDMGGTSQRLLLLGHNPSLELLAAQLIGSGDAESRAALAGKYPTCALAVIRFAAQDWSAIAEGGGELRAFVRPRDIEQPDGG